MNEYTQGVCQDGAAILKDGQQMTVDEILSELRQSSQIREAVFRALSEFSVDRESEKQGEEIWGCVDATNAKGVNVMKRFDVSVEGHYPSVHDIEYEDDGWLVLADEAMKIKRQRDQLREALENVMYYIETDDMRTLDLNKARAALKATEEG